MPPKVTVGVGTSASQLRWQTERTARKARRLTPAELILRVVSRRVLPSHFAGSATCRASRLHSLDRDLSVPRENRRQHEVAVLCDGRLSDDLPFRQEPHGFVCGNTRDLKERRLFARVV